MTSHENFVQQYTSVFSPLVETFYEQIKDLDVSGLPEPFLPLFGSGYAEADPRLLFIGIQTRGWGKLSNFIKRVQDKNNDRPIGESANLDHYSFGEGSSNSGMDFASFVLKFQAGFNGVANWNELKQGQHPELIRSLAWANTNVVEDYHVSAKGDDAAEEVWRKVKEAGNIFGGLATILKALAPQIVVICNWDCSQDWFTKGHSITKAVDVDDHVKYRFAEDSRTHIIQTAHPTWLRFNGFDEYVEKCVALAKEKLA